MIISLLNESATLSRTRSIAGYAAVFFLEINETRNVHGAVI